MLKLPKGKWPYAILTAVVITIVSYFLWKQCAAVSCIFFTSWREFITSEAIKLVPKILLAVILFIVFKAVYVLVVGFLLTKPMKRMGAAERLPGLTKVASLVWWVIYIIVALTLIVGDLGALLTSLGLVGFGLTFALQKPILNFVGWLTIIIKGVYSEGDRIQIGEIRGDVKEIQILNTVVDGLLENSDIPNNKVVTFPNEMVLTADVQNFTKESNYILEELSITITYESDYHKAISLLRSIISDQIRKNRKDYRKRTRETGIMLRELIKKAASLRGKKKETASEDAKRLQEEHQTLKAQSKEFEESNKEFEPKVHLEMLDSSIQLIASFLTPYDKIRGNRTAINMAFLDAIKDEKNIEVAYPHLQLIYDKKK